MKATIKKKTQNVIANKPTKRQNGSIKKTQLNQKKAGQ